METVKNLLPLEDIDINAAKNFMNTIISDAFERYPNIIEYLDSHKTAPFSGNIKSSSVEHWFDLYTEMEETENYFNKNVFESHNYSSLSNDAIKDLFLKMQKDLGTERIKKLHDIGAFALNRSLQKLNIPEEMREEILFAIEDGFSKEDIQTLIDLINEGYDEETISSISESMRDKDTLPDSIAYFVSLAREGVSGDAISEIRLAVDHNLPYDNLKALETLAKDKCHPRSIQAVRDIMEAKYSDDAIDLAIEMAKMSGLKDATSTIESTIGLFKKMQPDKQYKPARPNADAPNSDAR